MWGAARRARKDGQAKERGRRMLRARAVDEWMQVRTGEGPAAAHLGGGCAVEGVDEGKELTKEVEGRQLTAAQPRVCDLLGWNKRSGRGRATHMRRRQPRQAQPAGPRGPASGRRLPRAGTQSARAACENTVRWVRSVKGRTRAHRPSLATTSPRQPGGSHVTASCLGCNIRYRLISQGRYTALPGPKNGRDHRFACLKISSSIFDTRFLTWSSPIDIRVTARLTFAGRALIRLLPTTTLPARGARWSPAGW